MSSASSKYANLPDVDFDQPDLYESEDPKIIPDSSESIEYFNHYNRDLDVNNLDIKQAKEFFDIKYSESNDKNEIANRYRKALFNSYLLNRINSEISVSANPTSLPASDIQENILLNESNSEKLLRLTFEINQLLSQTEKNETEDNESKKSSILAAVSSLKKKLDSVSSNPIFFNQSDSLADSSTSWKKYYESVSSDKTSSITAAQRNNAINSVTVAEFERRLSAIENAIIPSNDIASTLTNNVPLSASINDLKNKVELLTNPKFLESVSKRAKFASEELDKLSKSKEILSSLASEQDKETTSQDKFQSAQDVLTRANQEKISALYEKLPSLEPMTLLIPSLLDRLDNLSKLHVKAASVVESFSHVDDFINVTQKSKISDLTQIVETLQSSIESNSALMVNNVKELEQRMANLSK
ncbi:putative dynactin subunit 2 [Smittium culicis]|uniref:Putative dynactin subunit 2 n=1 Tax=Smittium culicis TaxID=133412 RepID=A0A1R1XPK9_9FUNG|nr:putative dynactin subunit 2 [Smittium culicis]